MDLAILIVCYRCELEQSRTISGLMKHLTEAGENIVNVLIWNNGPKLWGNNINDLANNKTLNVRVVQTPENRPLSWIYNDFIAMYSSDYYVILDHDSEITEQFITDVQSLQHEQLCLPIIYSKGCAINPTCNGKFNPGPYEKNQKIMSIGSGLVLSQTLVDSLHKRWASVFDERFALYGVDTTFFNRINKLKCADGIRTISGFEHSLSRHETESEQVQKMRLEERSIDLGLSLRHYPSLGLYWHFLKILIKKCTRKGIVNLNTVMSSFLCGAHPRTKRQRNR
ncbi:glycosyltransferase family 2 protein [Pseudaeromonas sharmana]|uniref:Glycosyltransferase family 2 protein n=1 Tax=Pseudaeromonas sharmana TaxID=328412 RepID=A0ABV8CSA1_9GAMM